MNYLYQCAKCMKVYADQDEAWNCESSHEDVDLFNILDRQLNRYKAWKTGSTLPTQIAFASNPVYKGDTTAVHYGLYELKRELKPEEVEAMQDEYKALHPESED